MPEPVFAALRAVLDERQVVEVTVTVGGYAMVSRFLVALEAPAHTAEYSASSKSP